MQLTHDDLRSVFQADPKIYFCLLGLEHEMLGFDMDTNVRITYEQHLQPLLEYISLKGSWKPIYEGENIIGAENTNYGNLTLEPGGQFEFSSVPMYNLNHIETATMKVQELLQEAGKKFNIKWYSLGLDPISKVENIPLVPKQRYVIMNNYLPSLGEGAYYMMRNSCTAQANLDYSNEQDMVRKMRIATAFGTLVGILFASSPFQNGQDSGILSTRSWAWRNFSAQHSGFLDFVFDEDFGFDRYIEYLLDVPMYLIVRDGKMIDVHGVIFRDYMEHGAKGYTATLDDWKMHVGAVFPTARLRNVIETRTCDAGSIPSLISQIALWKGLFYDAKVLKEAESFIQEVGLDAFRTLHQQGHIDGWSTAIPNYTVSDLMKKMLELAKQGLMEQNPSELKYLDFPTKLIEKEESIAMQMLGLHKQGKSVEELFETFGRISFTK